MKNINNYINESSKSVEDIFDKISDVLSYIEPKNILDSLIQYLDVNTLADYYETYCSLWDIDCKEGLKNRGDISEQFDQIVDLYTPTEVLMELLSYMNVDELNDFYDYLTKEYDLED